MGNCTSQENLKSSDEKQGVEPTPKSQNSTSRKQHVPEKTDKSQEVETNVNNMENEYTNNKSTGAPKFSKSIASNSENDVEIDDTGKAAAIAAAFAASEEAHKQHAAAEEAQAERIRESMKLIEEAKKDTDNATTPEPDQSSDPEAKTPEQGEDGIVLPSVPLADLQEQSKRNVGLSPNIMPDIDRKPIERVHQLTAVERFPSLLKGSLSVEEKKTFISEIVPDSRRGDVLRYVPLFRSLTESQRDKLGGLMGERDFKYDTIVFNKGDTADGFYVIVHGSVRIISPEDNKTAVAHLRAGDYFGETALVNEDVRSATIIADDPQFVRCFFLDKDSFRIFFECVDVAFPKRSGIKDDVEIQENNIFKVPIKTAENAYKNENTISLLFASFNQNPLLRKLYDEQKRRMVENMHCITCKKDDVIITQNEFGSHLFVLQVGQLKVLKDGKYIGTMGANTVFGELSILYNARRAATVIALTDCVMWVLDRFSFKKIARNAAESSVNQIVQFLAEVPLLQSLTENEREKIAEAVEEVKYEAGDIICNEGDDGNQMYIMVKGHVQATKLGVNLPGGVVREYTKPGEYFGELALKSENEGKRQATIRACSTCYLLTLGRDMFKNLLGPLDDLLKKRADSYNVHTAPSGLTEIGDQDMVISDVKWENLVNLGTLGKGSFGHVQLVKDCTTGTYYALKSVWKKQIIDTQQIGHIISEKRVMERLQHPFLNTLICTYKSANRLHLLLEPCTGGELFTVLRKRKMFQDDTAKFYAASVVLAFSYMHSKDIIYRDLKPENLMLTDNGYVKVGDFGFAKLISGKTWTLCGTPDYLAPEIVSARGHGKAVDWWTLGILVYEMLASYPPFWDEDQIKTYSNILESNVRFPSHISINARDIINALLDKRPVKRIGVGIDGVERLQNHAWFRNFDWIALQQRTLPAPEDPIPKDLKNLRLDRPHVGDMVYVHNPADGDWDSEFGGIDVTDFLSKNKTNFQT